MDEENLLIGGFGQLPQNVDATGRMVRGYVTPIPEKKPVVSELSRPSFDLKKAPVFNNSSMRQKILLSNEAARFDIKENSSLGDPTLKERTLQSIFKSEDFGNKVVWEHTKTIEKIAKKHGMDPDLVKSVMWTENARGHYLGINNLADRLGKSTSQAPMNINGEIWGGLFDKPGKKLNNTEDNIEAGVILLKRISDRIENPTPEKIGSIWNFTGRENINEIGKEIGNAYRTKPWSKKK